MDKIKLNLQAPINPLGYGVVGINIAQALLKQNVDLHTHLIGNVQTDISNELSQSINNGIRFHDPSSPLIKIWHQHDLINRIGNGFYFGWPIFELDTFTDHEQCHLNTPDQLIVCSEWGQKIIADQCARSSIVIPLGIDPDIFYPAQYDIQDGPYKFFTIGKLEYRKGHDFIVDCFNAAFNASDNVELNMMVHNVFLDRKIIEHWLTGFKKSRLGQKINFINPVKSHTEVADFIRSQDCGLFPARAEGWNLELLESIACGKPVIVTNYSGHTEFCDKDNSYLIEVNDVEPAYDKMGGMWFHGQGNWAELDYDQEEQMIEYMRECYDLRQNWNNGGEKTRHRFTWANTAKKILEVI